MKNRMVNKMIKSLEKLYNNDTIQQTNNGQHCNNKCNH